MRSYVSSWVSIEMVEDECAKTMIRIETLVIQSAPAITEFRIGCNEIYNITE